MRYRVITESGEEFFIDALHENAVREQIDLREDEIDSIVSDPEPTTWYEEGQEFDPEVHLNYADWLTGSVPTEAIVDWEKWYSDFQLGFYVLPEMGVKTCHGAKALYFDCYMDEYDLVRMGDGYPKGLGEMKRLSVRQKTKKIGHQMREVLYVDVSFENNLDFEE